MIDLGHVLDSLRPGSQYTTRGDTYEGIEWNDSKQTIPTKEECEAERVRLEAEYTAQEYARNRKAEYPSINELIVALWENVVEERAASVIELEAKRQAVKTKYPKGQIWLEQL